MDKLFKKIKAGEIVQVPLNDLNTPSFLVIAKSEDEIILMGRSSIFYEKMNVKCNKVIIGLETSYEKLQLKEGDQLVVNLIDGEKIKMFVSYTIGLDGIVLGLTETATYSSLKWLIRIMRDHIEL